MMYPPSHPNVQLQGGTAQLDMPSQGLQRGPQHPSLGLNPFLCNICKRSYTRIDHLARHYRSHTKEKPFPCHLCEKEFGRADLLKRHVTAHEQDKSSRKRQKTAPPTTKSSRVSQACVVCAEAKLKCDQNKPCRRCQKRGIECEYPLLRIDKVTIGSREVSSEENIVLETTDLQTMNISQARQKSFDSQAGILEIGPSISDQHVTHDAVQLATPNTFAQDSIPSASIDMDGMMFDHSSLADFLCDIMMSPTGEMRNFGDPTVQGFASRDVLNFGVDTLYEYPVFDASLPIHVLDEASQTAQFAHTRHGMYQQNSASGARTPEMRNSINLGAQAFKESLWQWTPAQEDHGYAEQSNLSLSREDDNVPKSWFATNALPVEYRIEESVRDRVLGVVLSTCDFSVFPRVVSSFPSSNLLNNLLHNFIACHSRLTESWIHLATLQPNDIRPALLAIIVASGAVWSGVQVLHKLGFAIQEAVRLAVPKMFENDNRTTRDLQTLQAYALQLDLGLWSGDRRKTEMAESHFLPLVTMLRRAGHFQRPSQSLTAPNENDDVKILETKWRSWIEMESFKRLAFHLLIRDGQTSMSLLVPPLISYAEISAEMPASRDLWMAKSAIEWREVYLNKLPFVQERLPSLPHCIHDPTPLSKVQEAVDMGMATLIVLYGIWTLIWDYRQLNKVVKMHPTNTHWNSCLITTSLHQEVCHLLLHFHLEASEWGANGMQADSKLVYERCLMNLHVSFEDLQLFAGKEGEDEARRVYPLLTQWAESHESRQAVFHAGQVLRAAKRHSPKTLRESSAIALYHASLALWAHAVVSNSLKRPTRSSDRSRRLTSSDGTTAPEASDVTLVLLDGEDGPAVQRFLVLNKGVPAIRRGTSDQFGPASPGDADEYALLSDPKAVMDVAIDILMTKSQGEDKNAPSLSKNLSQLMRSLGSAARGIRRG